VATSSKTNADLYKNISFVKNFTVPYDTLWAVAEPILEEKLTDEGNPDAMKIENNAAIPLPPAEGMHGGNQTDATGNNGDYGSSEGGAQGQVYGPVYGDGGKNIDNNTSIAGSAKDFRKQQDVRDQKKMRNRALLEEKDDFIQFRDSISDELAQSLLHNIDPIPTIKILINLVGELLMKDSLEQEERFIMEHCLCIIVCLIMHHPDIMGYLLDPKKCNDLFDGDTQELRTEGASDFISFIMAGLSYQEVFLIRKQFNNTFLVMVREAKTPEHQKFLLGELLKKILNIEKKLNKGNYRYIELASTLLEDFCSGREDPKKLITKTDINDIINLETLFDEILEMLLKSNIEITKLQDQFDSDILIEGYFNLLRRILDIEPKIKHTQRAAVIVEQVFKSCLWNDNRDPGESGALKCKNVATRGPCYEFLKEMTKDNTDNSQALILGCFDSLCKNLPELTNWNYMPSNDRKSCHGFLGIYNLHSVCYMIAMLQQLYMTPAFRYSILFATDDEDEN
jgi:hypothetical protein